MFSTCNVDIISISSISSSRCVYIYIYIYIYREGCSNPHIGALRPGQRQGRRS